MRVIILSIISFFCLKFSNAQFPGKNWSRGAYYDLRGNRHSGYLCWTAPDETSKVAETAIYFKNDIKDKELQIYPDSLHGFVVERDSYGTIDSFIVSLNPLLTQKPVMEVLASRNPIKLYRSFSFIMSKPVKWADGKITPASRILHFDYYFGPNNGQLTLLGENNFYEVMQAIIADNAELTARVKNKEIEFKDILTLLYAYRFNSLPPASSPAPLKKSPQ